MQHDSQLPPPALISEDPAFDHARLDRARYNGLFKIPDRINYMRTVKDYVAHLRSLGEGLSDVDNEKEIGTAVEFLSMAKNHVAWSLSRAVVEEFQDLG